MLRRCCPRRTATPWSKRRSTQDWRNQRFRPRAEGLSKTGWRKKSWGANEPLRIPKMEGKLMCRLALLTVVLLLFPERQFFAQEVKERATLKGHTGTVWSVAFSPDGTTLASGTGEHNTPGEVTLWVVATGK